MAEEITLAEHDDIRLGLSYNSSLSIHPCPPPPSFGAGREDNATFPNISLECPGGPGGPGGLPGGLLMTVIQVCGTYTKEEIF